MDDHPGPDLGDAGLNLQACCMLVFQIVNPECDVDLCVINIQLIRHSMTTTNSSDVYYTVYLVKRTGPKTEHVYENTLRGSTFYENQLLTAS